MEFFASLLAIAAVVFLCFHLHRPESLVDPYSSERAQVAHLPDRFVVFDLETTGLDPNKHEIIEIGAIRVNLHGKDHDTFQVLIKPKRKVSKKITELTGITREVLAAHGNPLEPSLREFLDFVGDLPLVAFNAEFDMGFLKNAAHKYSIEINNPVSCALKMARRAWPNRRSYRLSSLAEDAGMSGHDTHRALGDSTRTMKVYVAAASVLGTAD